ncbi:MAG: glutamate racemase [Oscillospiraceae bacterium]|nr:glutamate racemase [Oscillospiraceae bacterium]
MDTRPIGVFDSGLGGLTAVRQLMRQLPGEDIIYFGDTGRVPYGVRSAETIQRYVRQDIHFLLQFHIKAIMIACNTADAIAREAVAGDYPVPIYGVTGAAGRAAVHASKNGKIGLIATPATVDSGIFKKIIGALQPRAQVMSVACPLLVPLVENGRVARGDMVIETVIAEYLKPLRDWGCDTLVLGCTHYPLLSAPIAAYMGTDVTLIDSGREAAQTVAAQLADSALLNAPEHLGKTKFYVSDSPAGFEKLASLFLQRPVEGAVEQINIEAY